MFFSTVPTSSSPSDPYPLLNCQYVYNVSQVSTATPLFSCYKPHYNSIFSMAWCPSTLHPSIGVMIFYMLILSFFGCFFCHVILTIEVPMRLLPDGSSSIRWRVLGIRVFSKGESFSKWARLIPHLLLWSVHPDRNYFSSSSGWKVTQFPSNAVSTSWYRSAKDGSSTH